MGYDAYVPCACYCAGLAAPPPFPVIWNEREGAFEPHPSMTEQEGDLLDQIWDWQEQACAHQDMQIVSERLGNIGLIADLRAAIAAVGADQLPLLSRYLPTANGGHVPPELSPQIINELNRFEQLVRGVPVIVLRDGETGAELYSSFPGQEFVFKFTPHGEVGLGKDFFVRQDGTIVFHGRNVRQELMRESGMARYENLDTSEVVANLPAFGGYDEPVPRLLKVEVEQVNGAEYGEVITALRRLFRASVAVGNPVYWA